MKTVGSMEHETTLYASCRKIAFGAPFAWLAKGWQDYRRAPLHSLSYGVIFTVIGWALLYVSRYQQDYLVTGLLISVLVIGPALAFGLYVISQQLEENQKPSFRYQRHKALQKMGHELMLVLLMSMAFLVLLLVTPMVMGWVKHTQQFAVTATVPMPNSETFSIAGFFAWMLFWVSMFALPMIIDKNTSATIAISTSVHAVWRNKLVLGIWSFMILVLTVIGLATGLIGFVVIVPLLGYATWHAYRDTVISDSI